MPLSAGSPSNQQFKDTNSPSVAAEPFGVGAMPLSDGGLHTKWIGVSRAIDADLETIRSCRSGRAECTPAAIRLIVATGHADRSGPTAYNQRLSERRAAAVKTALVREGVSEGTIQTAGRGENENLVPTADGVREPRNRRVEIVFR